MKEKRGAGVPHVWKNTYFSIAAILFLVGVFGLLRGEASIRDPGQRPEARLVLIYFGAAAVMLVNGVIGHRLTRRDHEEAKES